MRHTEFAVALTSLFAIAYSSRAHPRSDVELEPLEPLKPVMPLEPLEPLEPIEPSKRSGSMQSWRVTRLSTYSPSGRPGSSPIAHLWATITNPDPVPASPAGTSPTGSTANCTVDWDFASERPYGRAVECVTEQRPGASVSAWTIELFEANSTWASPTENVDVRFTLSRNLTVDGVENDKVFVGTQHFEVGDNMRGTCGGSGVCSWELRQENIPVLIEPAVVGE
ncbi:hypothetical protein F4677DRAFT_290840 [Hypoxylon crocopeplum]|nr:hypothetical protein F4677DRAFT_290840 [Hypoxylon crocopeplum]